MTFWSKFGHLPSFLQCFIDPWSNTGWKGVCVVQSPCSKQSKLKHLAQGLVQSHPRADISQRVPVFDRCHTAKRFCLVSNQNFPCFTLWVKHPILSVWASEENLAPSSLKLWEMCSPPGLFIRKTPADFTELWSKPLLQNTHWALFSCRSCLRSSPTIAGLVSTERTEVLLWMVTAMWVWGRAVWNISPELGHLVEPIALPLWLTVTFG